MRTCVALVRSVSALHSRCIAGARATKMTPRRFYSSAVEPDIGYPKMPAFLPARSSCAFLTSDYRHCLVSTRSYASKNRGKDKTKAKSPAVSADQLQEVVDFAEYESSAKNLVDEFRELLSKQFALRTSSASFEAISAEIDGKKQPLNSIVQITFKTPQLVMLNLSANPTYIPAVVKALETSGLNLSPQVEGHVVYIAVPKVSRDHREALVKNAKAASNKFKERLRTVQNGYVRTAKSKADVSEDLVRGVVVKIMEHADSVGKELDAALLAKEKELLTMQS